MFYTMEEFWTSHETGCRIVLVTIGINHFRLLLAFFRIDNIHTRKEGRKDDKLAAVRLFFDDFIGNFRNGYIIREYATLD